MPSARRIIAAERLLGSSTMIGAWTSFGLKRKICRCFALLLSTDLKQILADFPDWHIAVRVDVPGTEEAWPLMGILIFRDRVIDHLKREYLPAEFRANHL